MWLYRENDNENTQQNEIEETQNFYDIPDVPLWKQYLYDRRIQGIIVLVLIAVILPAVLLYILSDRFITVDTHHTCSIKTDYRVSCGKHNITFEKCTELSCCFDDITRNCYHFVPSKYTYRADEKWLNGGSLSRSIDKTPYGVEMYPKIYLTLTEETEKNLLISLHRHQNEITTSKSSVETEYISAVYVEHGAVEIKRKSDGNVILTTAKGPVIASQHYWEWTVDLNAEYLYGMDELRFEENRTVTKVVYSNEINHGNVVRFMAYRHGMFHGLTIENPKLLEVTVLPSQLIVVKMLAGENLTFRLSLGPTPKDVNAQQNEIEAVIPPFWMLGVHVCRDGSLSFAESLEEFYNFSTIVTDPKKEFPFDSDCIQGNLFSLTMNVSQEQLAKLTLAVQSIQKNDRRFIMSLSPHVDTRSTEAYKEALKLDILYKYSGNILKGTYQGNSVAFLDMSNAKGQMWYTRMYNKLPVQGEAFVLRNNWPENVNCSIPIENFQYLTKEIKEAMFNTIPWDAKSSSGVEHVLEHNNYGQDHVRAMLTSSKDKYLLSASHNNLHQYGIHKQNFNISWLDFKKAVKLTVSSGLFVNAFISIPVCGTTKFYNSRNEALCSQWYKTAAVMPLFRISSEQPRRDPSAFSIGTNRNIAVDAIKLRYNLISYMYTLLIEKELTVRPMFFDFYSEEATLKLDEQFMLGHDLMTAYSFLPETPILRIYFPKVVGGWYEFFEGRLNLNSGWKNVTYLTQDFIMYIAAGRILPLHEEIDKTADKTRLKPWRLAVALNCTQKPCFASGKLCLQVNVCIQFSYIYREDGNSHQLNVTNINNVRGLLCGPTKVSTSLINSFWLYGVRKDIVEKKDFNLDLCNSTNTISKNFTI